MLNTVHVATAAAIVTVVPNPVISLPLAFLSHFVLDTIPHWNWSPGRTSRGRAASIIDGVVGLGLTAIFTQIIGQTWIMVAAGVLSMTPDIIQAPYHFWRWQPLWLKTFIEWERRRQKWPWMKPWMGVATQVAAFAISVWIMWIILG